MAVPVDGSESVIAEREIDNFTHTKAAVPTRVDIVLTSHVNEADESFPERTRLVAHSTTILRHGLQIALVTLSRLDCQIRRTRLYSTPLSASGLVFYTVERLNCLPVKTGHTMSGKTTTNLNDLTTNQKAILKVLADADGDALRGVEVRRRLREDYNIELTRGGMNSATRRTSRYPRHMVDIGWVDDSEIEGNTRHAYHRLKEEYIEKVREQLK